MCGCGSPLCSASKRQKSNCRQVGTPLGEGERIHFASSPRWLAEFSWGGRAVQLLFPRWLLTSCSQLLQASCIPCLQSQPAARGLSPLALHLSVLSCCLLSCLLLYCSSDSSGRNFSTFKDWRGPCQIQDNLPTLRPVTSITSARSLHISIQISVWLNPLELGVIFRSLPITKSLSQAMRSYGRFLLLLYIFFLLFHRYPC